MNSKNKIKSRLLEFTLLILGLFIVTLINNIKETPQVHSIEIKGNKYLSAEAYKNFANLESPESFRNISIKIIMDRLNKHPYVKFVDVYYSGGNKYTVLIHEKTFNAILLGKNKQYLVDENLRIEPLLPYTNNVDLPIIENVKIKGKKIIGPNEDLVTAEKILFSAKLLNVGLLNDISEIDMNNGGDIIIWFNSEDYKLILGRGNEVEKVIYFNSVYEKIKNTNEKRVVDYIDLRFDGQICFGFKPKLISYLERQT